MVVAAIDEAKKAGVPVLGHLGQTSWTEAARAGISGLVHSGWAGPSWELISREKRSPFLDIPFKPTAERFRGWRESLNLEGPEMESLISALVENRVVLDPTFVMTRAIMWGDDMSALEWMEPTSPPAPNKPG